MKSLMLVLLLVITPAIFAEDIDLAWDYVDPSSIDGYGLFDKNFQKPYDYENPIWITDDPNLMDATIVIPDDRHSTAVARAWRWGLYDMYGVRQVQWSNNSNEVEMVPEQPPIEPPTQLSWFAKLVAAVMDFFEASRG